MEMFGIITQPGHDRFGYLGQRHRDSQDFEPGDTVINDQWDRTSVVGLDPGSSHDGLAYNLTVADTHTHHVGGQRVLVHNCNKGGDATSAAFGARLSEDLAAAQAANPVVGSLRKTALPRRG